MNTQFLLYLDAPSGVHQVLATNMIKGIGPFKMPESEVIQLANDMKGAKEASSVIWLHSGATHLAMDTFEELVEALYQSSVLAVPETAIDPDTVQWVLQTKLREAPLITVATPPPPEIDPNKLRSH